MRRAFVAAIATIVALALAPASLAAAADPKKRPLTVEELWAIQRVGAPVLSPDGATIAHTVTSYDMEENHGGQTLPARPARARRPGRHLRRLLPLPLERAGLRRAGYVVAMVNFHGSSSFGQPFVESILGAHPDKPFTDVMRATDALVAQGLADPARMAAAGGSYGGFLVNWIAGHTDRFQALVSHAGVYDLLGQ
jgi:dipeptidyl aminopeptidase/acylaminoacyl peptidase